MTTRSTLLPPVTADLPIVTDPPCACGHYAEDHERCDFPARDDCTVCTCQHFAEPPLVGREELLETAADLVDPARGKRTIADQLTAAAIRRGAADANELHGHASTEARRLILLVELEQLTTDELVELSAFLNGLLAPAPPADDRIARAVSVRAAIAFGDWPPRLEAIT